MENVTVTVDGTAETIEVGSKCLVGLAGVDDVRYGFALEVLDGDGFGCDLFFRNAAFDEHDVFGYVWLEVAREAESQADTAQEAVDYAMDTLRGMMQQLDDHCSLTVCGERGNVDKVTILA